MRRIELLILGVVLAAAGLAGAARAQGSDATIHTRPVVCHYGWNCHQWRTVAPAGKSLVVVHERRHALTPLGPWTPWAVMRLS